MWHLKYLRMWLPGDSMQIRSVVFWALAGLAPAETVRAAGALQAGATSRLVMLASSGSARDSLAPVHASARPQGAIVREIDDPHNGDRWLLVRDPRHPAGPGLLLREDNARGGSPQIAIERRTEQAGQSDAEQNSAPLPEPAGEVEAAALVVHAGDRLVVEEHTAIIEARLEAVALGSASSGSPFNARLRIGGRVVRVLAVAAGRAVIQGQTP
jgi:hypothetical protein